MGQYGSKRDKICIEDGKKEHKKALNSLITNKDGRKNYIPPESSKNNIS